MQKLNKFFNLFATTQREPIPGSTQVPNNAGGYAWKLDAWQQLDRFLILGTEGGTFYVSERKLTVENATAVMKLITEDGVRVVARICEISVAGRAAKNDPALFALALAFASGDAATKTAAASALTQVARTGTHLFSFLEYVESMRGWGRGLRRAVGNWYTSRDLKELAYQVTKYAQREGWSHRDALRLAHPKATAARNELFAYIVGKGPVPEGDAAAWVYLRAVAQVATPGISVSELCQLIRTHRLPREVIPTEWLQQAAVWEALLEKMPLMATMRNLATLTRIGVLAPNSEWTRNISERLTNQEWIRKARLHPVQVLSALKTYASGHGIRGQNSWEPVQQIVDALDKAFYLAFDNVVPTGKRIVLAVDVSGSMGMGNIGGAPGLTPRDAAAALTLVTAATESSYHIMGFSNNFMPLRISPRKRLDDVIRYMSGLPFGGTDCAQPMIWALEKNVAADAFIVLTDSETWAGKIHPAQALEQYRRKMNIPAKLIVVGMTSSGFTIGDPNDAGTLNIVGFTPDIPTIVNDFIRGEK